MANLIDNIVAYWKMDSNNINIVTNVSGVDTAVTYSNANGIINNGGGYNGTTSESTFAAPNVDAYTAFTLSVWIFPTVLPSTPSQEIRIISRKDGGGSGQPSFGITFFNSAGTVGLYGFINNQTPTTGSSSKTVTGSFLNSWHHVVLTYNGTTVTLYVDNVAQTGASLSGSIYTTGTEIVFGSRETTAPIFDEFYTGNIDEVGIWNRVLSTTEISALYNSGKGLQYPFNSGFFAAVN